MSARRSLARHGGLAHDAGFTLIELLITITILGLVISAIGSAIYVGLRTTGTTESRFLESHDGQLMGIYFPVDAGSATGVRRDVTTCGELAGAGETAVVFFKWTEGAVAKASAWFTKTVGSNKQMIRRKCSAGAQQSETIAAQNLPTTNPTIACTGSGTPCPATGTGTTFTSVSINVVQTNGYAFTLTGARRSA